MSCRGFPQGCYRARVFARTTPNLPAAPRRPGSPAAHARNDILRARRRLRRATRRHGSGCRVRSRIEAKMPLQLRSNLWRGTWPPSNPAASASPQETPTDKRPESHPCRRHEPLQSTWHRPDQTRGMRPGGAKGNSPRTVSSARTPTCRTRWSSRITVQFNFYFKKIRAKFSMHFWQRTCFHSFTNIAKLLIGVSNP